MQNLINEIENIIPTGRALSALLIALEVISKKTTKREIIVPSVCCPAIIETVYSAGFQPIFSDINIKTLTTSSQNIIPKLTDDTAAVLVIYLYGHSTDIQNIIKLSKAHSFFIIEPL